MMTVIIDGRELAGKIKAQARNRAAALKEKGISPKIAVVLAGENEASKIYVREKIKACSEAGIETQLLHFPETDTASLISEIKKLNDDSSVHAILVQLPLPENADENSVLESISPEKDVDCLNPLNLGRLLAGSDVAESCTPKGIMRVLDYFSIPLEGKNAVVINRSTIIGKPLALMLLKRNATVCVCHSKTRNIADFTKKADIVVVGVGKKGFLTSEMIKDGAVVIDAGINKEEGRLSGDVDPGVNGKASYLTPVPGGVGPVTVAMVLENTVMLAERQAGNYSVTS